MTQSGQPHSHMPAASTSGGTLLLAIAIAVVTAGFFFWREHQAHLLGALPYLLLLACPLVHFLMHGRHGGHAGSDRGEPHRSGDAS